MANQRLNIDIVARDKSKQALNNVRGALSKVKGAVFNLQNAFIGLGAGLAIRNLVNTGKEIENLRTIPAPKPKKAFLRLNTAPFTIPKDCWTRFKACFDLSFATISMFSFWFAITLSSLIVLMLVSFYTVLVLFSSKLTKDYNG